MEGNTTPWIIVLVLAGCLALLAGWHRFRTRRLQASLESTKEESEASLSELATESAAQREQIHSDYSIELAAKQRAHDQYVRALSDRHQNDVRGMDHDRRVLVERYEALAKKLDSATNYEQPSRRFILDQCRRLDLNGVLLTNIRFPTPTEDGRYFLHQVDHLLLTERSVTLIENKHWTGLIFDGTLPRGEHRSWKLLFPDLDLGDDFAIQPQRKAETPGQIDVRIVAEDHNARSPRRQAINQAADLRTYLQSLSDCRAPDFIHPAVFYSHSDSYVVATDERLGRRKVDVPVLTTVGNSVHDLLLLRSREPGPSVDVRCIVDALAPQTTDITGFGTFAGSWTSTFT